MAKPCKKKQKAVKEYSPPDMNGIGLIIKGDSQHRKCDKKGNSLTPTFGKR